MDYRVFTDGSALGNPGPGGWGCVIEADHIIPIELSGGDAATTNNRMELKAVIKALEELPENSSVTVTSDSKYVCEAINSKWIDSWKNNGWKTSSKKPVKNIDLWTALDTQLNKFSEIEFVWVKGHAGHPQNERCDELARGEAEKLQADNLLVQKMLEENQLLADTAKPINNEERAIRVKTLTAELEKCVRRAGEIIEELRNLG